LWETVNALCQQASTPEGRDAIAQRQAGPDEVVMAGDDYVLAAVDAEDFPHKSISEIIVDGVGLKRDVVGLAVSHDYFHDFKMKYSKTGTEILGLPAHKQLEFFRALILRMITIESKFADGPHPLEGRTNCPARRKEPCMLLRFLMTDLLRRKLPLDEGDMIALVKMLIAIHSLVVRYATRPLMEVATRTVEKYVKSNGLSAPLRVVLQALIERLRKSYERYLDGTVIVLEALLATGDNLPLDPGEAWSDRALADLQQLEPQQRDAWSALICHAQSASGSKPSAKWSKTASPLLDAVGYDELADHLAVWASLVDRPRTQPIENSRNWQPDPNLLIVEKHALTLKGFAWMASGLESADLARGLGLMAQSAYRKIPGMGARAVSLGNACVWSLGQMPGQHGLSQLAILKVRVKFGTAQKGIEKALNATAERLGYPRDEVEEMGVPAYGMEEVGHLRAQAGDFKAELAVTGTASTELRWIKPDGKVQKSIPQAVKSDYPGELKELKTAAKDIQKMLPAQGERIDRLFLERKAWSVAKWRDRYLDHPLMGTLARRLIWVLQDGDVSRAVMYCDGVLMDERGSTVDVTSADATVSLWHPIGQSTDDVLAWRDFLEKHEIVQPLKQAHREVYLLTDAERQTSTYSNRFAAHVLKQHQFHALCARRGWKNKLRLMVDDEYPPASRELPKWNLRAEFWIEGAGDNWGTDTTESGTYLYLVTDQVRFYAIDAATVTAHAGGGGYGWGAWREGNEPLPIALSEIPRLVLSEIMRDVDLFVGVASVGNDPNWADGGPEATYRDYWNGFSFGELSATAETRKSILQRLIPRLKIADQCSFEGRFLVVKGKIRTYKIHLGSGNILMAPTDTYLCIVPKASAVSSATGKVYLPFEGDRTMAIVLSKAMLLADDTKIKNQSILSQIGA
jgi:hypothetical protein